MRQAPLKDRKAKPKIIKQNVVTMDRDGVIHIRLRRVNEMGCGLKDNDVNRHMNFLQIRHHVPVTCPNCLDILKEFVDNYESVIGQKYKKNQRVKMRPGFYVQWPRDENVYQECKSILIFNKKMSL